MPKKEIEEEKKKKAIELIHFLMEEFDIASFEILDD